jgi:hypothetical protein
MATDIVKIINAAGLLAMPALTAWMGLSWYFEKNGKSTRTIFIVVAGLLSATLYSYLVWTSLKVSLIFVSIWVYLGLSALAVVVYFALYNAYDGKADLPTPKWVLPAALLSYIALFCAVGIFSAAALARRDYLLFGGHVFVSVAESKQPLPDVSLILLDGNASTLDEIRSDARGRFLFFLKSDEYKDRPEEEKPATLLVKTINYGEQKLNVRGGPKEKLDVVFDSKHAPHR